MMIARFAVLLVVIAVTSGSPSKPGCCVPPQWEGVVGSVIGGVSKGKQFGLQQTQVISYDETNQRIKTDVYTQGKHVKVIQDFAKGKQYLIEESSCKVSVIPTTFTKGCIPKNAEVKGDYYLGIGNDSLPAVSFGVVVAGAKFFVGVLREGCIPISEVISGKNFLGFDGYMQTSGFVNLTPGIKDPSVFKVPEICFQAQVTNSTNFPRGLFHHTIF